MSEILIKYILFTGLSGSLGYVLLLAARPLMKRQKPAMRKHALLCVGLLFLLPVALLTGGMAGWAVPGQPSAPASALAQAGPVAPAYRAGQSLSAILENEAPAARPKAAPAAGWRWPQWVLLAYMAGLAAALGVQGMQRARMMKKLKAGCVPLTEGPVAELYAQLCAEAGAAKGGRRTAPGLYTGAGVTAPVLVGLLRPRVVLPAGTQAVSEDEKWKLAFALRHELCHHKHKDLLQKQLMNLVQAVHWYNPLVLLLRHAFNEAAEQYCDTVVTDGSGQDGRRAYAAVLLQYAGLMPAGISAFSGPMRRLRRRLALLARPAAPGRGTRGVAMAALVVVLCAGLLAGCAMAAGAGDASQPQSGSALPPSSSVPQPASLPSSSLPSSSLLEEEPVSSTSGDYVMAIAPGEGEDYLIPVPGATHCSRGKTEQHRGLDLNAPEGTPIYVIAAGEVTEAGYHYSYGNYVVVNHGNGLSSLYAHCAELTAEAGQVVQQGDQIATVGGSGMSAGTHCHLEIIQENGEVDDPLNYITLPEGLPGP